MTFTTPDGTYGITMKPNRLMRWFMHRQTNAIRRGKQTKMRGVDVLALITTGRKSGKTYETPLILARVPAGFVAELTYGPAVDWYRNIEAAGECVVISGGEEHRIDRIEPCDPDAGIRAYGYPAALVLRILRRHEFRLLHEEVAFTDRRAGTAR